MIRSVVALGHQAFKTHTAGCPKQVRPNFAAFKRIDEDAFRPPRKQAFKAGLADVQRRLASKIGPDVLERDLP